MGPASRHVPKWMASRTAHTNNLITTLYGVPMYVFYVCMYSIVYVALRCVCVRCVALRTLRSYARARATHYKINPKSTQLLSNMRQAAH